MTHRADLLIQCYLSGQVDESDWQRLLRDEPGLREKCAAHIQHLNDDLNRRAELARAVT